MKESMCLTCGEVFSSKIAKYKHKKEYPNASCETEENNMEEKIPERKSPIQKVAKILVPKEQAKEEWKKYCELLNKRKNKHYEHLKILKKTMYYAKQGKQFIDVYEVMKKAGLNSKNEPRLAIARADLNQVQFEKRDTGTGRFNMDLGWNKRSWKDNVDLPQKTFKIEWERKLDSEGNITWELKEKIITAKVPVIPADLMPEGDLKNYYVLWEVKQWEQLPEPKDPFLLKRISENLFVILGAWDLTPLERSVMAGLK